MDTIHSDIRVCSRYKLDNSALRFGSDLVAAIEQNRRRSGATSRILQLSRGQRWPEDEMQYVQVILEQTLSPIHPDMLRHSLWRLLTAQQGCCAGLPARFSPDRARGTHVAVYDGP